MGNPGAAMRIELGNTADRKTERQAGRAIGDHSAIRSRDFFAGVCMFDPKCSDLTTFCISVVRDPQMLAFTSLIPLGVVAEAPGRLRHARRPDHQPPAVMDGAVAPEQAPSAQAEDPDYQRPRRHPYNHACGSLSARILLNVVN